MNIAPISSNGRRRARNRRRRQRRAAIRRGMVAPLVVPVSQRPGRRGRRRRTRRNRGNRGSGGGLMEEFNFIVDGIKANSSGVLKFGPHLTQSAAFSSGILAAYKQYKIYELVVQYISESSSQTAGSIQYELDPSCTATGVTSALRRFAIAEKKQQAVFTAASLGGQEWVPTSKDQFYFAYKGNGTETVTAGCLLFKMRCSFLDPK
ncbi:coat protein [Persimmon polerovirus]|nr:coat protein [Persimmon polerovirus]